MSSRQTPAGPRGGEGAGGGEPGGSSAPEVGRLESRGAGLSSIIEPLVGAWWLGGLRYSPAAIVGLAIVAIYVVAALIGPLLAPYPHTEFHLKDALQPPSGAYLFGTDQFGRDVFSRVLVGSRNILVLTTAATGLGMLLGITAGLIAGYHGGVLDEVTMRLMDVMMSFPALLLALLILSTMGPALINVIVGIAIVFMPRVARLVRSVVLEIKTLEYVAAARVRGESSWYIMLREILPNATGPIVVESSIRFSYAILLGASLGFLGLGVQPPAADWGLQVSEGRRFILSSPWVVLFPSLAIASLVVGVNLLADGLGRLVQSPGEVGQDSGPEMEEEAAIDMEV